VENRFQHIPSIIGALEAEEVGVEHLLRDVKDTNISTLATRINNKLASLQSLISRLQDMSVYLQNVVSGKVPINNTVCNRFVCVRLCFVLDI
jgi:26S proteasome regulatory subunit N8